MNLLQIRASDPEISTWVSASAGTGKTKILTDRVLRLLLANFSFNKILCLTFTNAAAGEMKERITSSLADWSKISNDELKHKLFELFGRKVKINELELAKNLYEQYLRSDEQINVQTIHSFCQSLLKKFPLEAGISPSFKIIDESKTYDILQEIKQDLFKDANLEPINNYLTANFHETTIDDIFSEIVQNRTKFSSDSDQIDNIYDKSKKIIDGLDDKKNNNYYYQSILQHPIVQNIVGFAPTIEQITTFFLNKDGQKRKRIVPNKIAKLGSNLYDDLIQIQHQIYLLDQAQRRKHLECHSELLYMLGVYIVTSYDSYKFSKGWLDYDDLIIHSTKLLQLNSAKEWVLYKLDGGIDHLLVDEAQDTSANQWKIIESLISEFYSGESANREKKRTVFVVGDEKQSIFSFQGADVESFTHMNQLIKQKMLAGGKNFDNVNLDISYRSAKEILEIVYKVFNKIRSQMPTLFTSQLTNLSAFRTKYSGSVELWSLCRTDNKNNDFWKVATTTEDSNYAQTELAHKISNYIKNQLATGKIIPSTNKPIAPSDFMILFRKRDDFTKKVIKILKESAVEVAGLDRIYLKENIVVLDLISVAKFVLNTNDDLNLASLLKSPLIGLADQELHNIAITRGKLSIWDYIESDIESDKIYQHLYDKLSVFINLFNKSDVSDFFQYIVDVLGYRELLNKYCGADNNDAIDELLYICNDFSNQNNSSLQNFIFWFENYNNSIKRDCSSSRKVKIMTVHASKGLQSPYVILCDTTTVPINYHRFLSDNNGKTLSAHSASYVPDYYKELKQEQQNKSYAEYLRLLYVGITRAENHLIICGYKNSKNLPDNCWYKILYDTMEESAIKSEDGVLTYGTKHNNEESTSELVANSSKKIFYTPIVPIASHKKHNNDSLNIAKHNIVSPLYCTDPMQYGVVFHKILEDALNAQNIEQMHKHPLIDSLDIKSQTRIKSSISKIIKNNELNQLINKTFKTELIIGTRDKEAANNIKICRIDLMIMDSDQITIIDYKSDISPASDNKHIPENYCQQLSIYKQIIQQIYPNHTIRTMILWLSNGVLMQI